MKIVSAEFILSAFSPRQYPEGNLPEVAFVGRSNVGKSSLINTLVNRKKLAKTSSRPGKTQAINFFVINDAFYLVDLPGYGFAKVSKEIKAQWGIMIEQYLAGRGQNLIVLLVDFRHPPTADDLEMYSWLKHFGKTTLVVATKADKISRGHWPKHLKVIKEKLQLQPEDQLITFSTETRQGKDEILAYLEQMTGQVYSSSSETSAPANNE